MNASITRLGLLLFLIAAATTFAADPPEKAFDLALAHGTLPAHQRALRVEKGDTVRLRFTSDAEGDIHLHAYRLSAKVAPAHPAEFKFKAHATGRFRIEWHAAVDAGKKSDHHGPPLAILEVRPK